MNEPNFSRISKNKYGNIIYNSERDYENYNKLNHDFVRGTLEEKYIVPPFSVLDTRKGYWKKRRDLWFNLTGDLTATRDINKKFEVNGVNLHKRSSSIFDPVLAEIMFRWFGSDDSIILDPFAGNQSKGVVAGALGLEYHGVDIRDEQVKNNMYHCKNYSSVFYYCGDSLDICSIVPNKGYDLCVTSPPYYDLEVYSDFDLSSLESYDVFLDKYKSIFGEVYRLLVDGGFLVLLVGEVRDKLNGNYMGI